MSYFFGPVTVERGRLDVTVIKREGDSESVIALRKMITPGRFIDLFCESTENESSEVKSEVPVVEESNE